MWTNENKFYVVRKWKETWIFNSREECKKNVEWFSNAKYKSFKNLLDAKAAISQWRESYYNNKPQQNPKFDIRKVPFYSNSIAVDAACSGNPWVMEYRWVDIQTWQEIFHQKFQIWTNNIWEFLAIVNWLQYLWDDDKVIYSDSKIAISRIYQWKCKTQIKKSDDKELNKTLKAIKNAEEWLQHNNITHKILKWDTEQRWEIPADFGRK